MAELIVAPPSKVATPFHGTREEARAVGAVRYIDGRPCNRDHSPTIRLASNTQCITCRDMKQAELKVESRSPRVEGFIDGAMIGDKPVYRGSRLKALAAGAMYYINYRRPCTDGHDPTVRLVSTTACVQCAHEYHFAHRDEINAGKRQLRADNPELFSERGKARYAANPEYFKEYVRRWQAENEEYKKQIDAIWRIENAEHLREYYAAWRRANPDKVAAKVHKRRASKLGSTEHFTAEDIQEIFVMQRGRCACCGKKLKTIEARDHIIALARGGSNGRRNLQITCGPCNRKKGARDPLEFMRSEFGKLL